MRAPKIRNYAFLHVILICYELSVRVFKLTFIISLTSTVESFNPAAAMEEMETLNIVISSLNK